MHSYFAKQRKYFPVFIITFFDHLSLNITAPVLAFIFFDKASHLFPLTAALSYRSHWYGICLAANSVASIITAPFLGHFADHFGRKKMLLLTVAGALGIAVLGGLSILLGMISLFFLGRLISGLCTRSEPISLAIIGDLAEPHEKIHQMAFLQVLISAGAMLGPILGGYVAKTFFATLNFSFSFILSALVALITLGLTLFYFRESYIKPTSTTEVKPSTTLFNREIVLILFLLIGSQFTWSMYYQFIPVTLKVILDFSTVKIGLFIGLMAFWLACACGFGIQSLARFFNLHQILKIGVWCLFLASLINGIVLHFLLIAWLQKIVWLLAIPIAIGDMLIYCVIITLLSNITTQQKQGKIMGIVYMAALSMWAITSLLGGWFGGKNILLPLSVAPIGSLLLLQMINKFK